MGAQEDEEARLRALGESLRAQKGMLEGTATKEEVLAEAKMLHAAVAKASADGGKVPKGLADRSAILQKRLKELGLGNEIPNESGSRRFALSTLGAPVAVLAFVGILGAL